MRTSYCAEIYVNLYLTDICEMMLVFKSIGYCAISFTLYAIEIVKKPGITKIKNVHNHYLHIQSVDFCNLEFDHP